MIYRDHTMRPFIYLITTIMLFGLFGCKGSKDKDFVFDEFKSQIEKLGMKIDSVDETGLIYISQGELTLKISLDNVRKNYDRDKNATHISDLVKALVEYSIEIPSKVSPRASTCFFLEEGGSTFYAGVQLCG
ncbi:hypothetical protein, partial [Chitinophaga sp. GbtcB8]|uniref:hypothetical protein n=1 Tax=Chitinophaga sp. GbtcB8 TaxID=2824753 RepID=UPI001C30004A